MFDFTELLTKLGNLEENVEYISDYDKVATLWYEPN